MNELYSFVLPAYKASYLNEAIESILCQTYDNFELIIVNDNSPEDLDSIVKRFDDSRIRYYKNKENIGKRDLIKQWNHCITYAVGKYLILASDDDIYSPDYLMEMNSLVMKYPDVNVYRSRVQHVNAEGDIIFIEGVVDEYMSYYALLYSWIYGIIGSGVAFYVFNKDALVKNGGFVNYQLGWFSDDATVFKLAKEGIVSTSKILFSFRSSGENISSRLNSKKMLEMKIDATTSFYQDICDSLIGKDVKMPIELYYYNSIKEKLPYFIECNKLYGQFFHASVGTIIQLLPKIYFLDYVKTIRLIKYIIYSSFKRLKYQYKRIIK